MLEIGTSGLMSGKGKRADCQQVSAPRSFSTLPIPFPDSAPAMAPFRIARRKITPPSAGRQAVVVIMNVRDGFNADITPISPSAFSIRKPPAVQEHHNVEVSVRVLGGL